MKQIVSLVAAMLLLCFTSIGHAQQPADPCGVVYDGTNTVPEGTAARIRADIEALQRELPGVNAHVHIGQNLRLNGQVFRDIDAYSDALDRMCGWEYQGGVANGTLVYIVIVDAQEFDIYNGRLMEPYLTLRSGPLTVKDHILDNIMPPHFHEGDFGAAMRDAVHHTLTRVRAFTAAVPPIQNPAGSIPAPISAPTQIRAESNPFLMLLLLAIIVCSVLAFFLWQWVSNILARRREISGLHTQYAALRTACSNTITTVGDADKAIGLARINSAAERIGKEAIAAIRQEYDAAWTSISEQRRAFADISTAYDAADRKDVAALRQMIEQLERLKLGLSVSHSFVQKLEEKIAAQLSNIDRLMERPLDVTEALEICLGRIEVVGAAGLPVQSFKDDLSAVKDALHQVLAAIEALQFGAVEQNCADLIARAHRAAENAEALLARRNALQATHTTYVAQLEAMGTLVEEADTAHQILEDGHPEQSWAHVAGNGTEAEDRLEWSGDQLPTVLELIAAHSFDEADELLRGIAAAITEAEQLLRAIIDQKVQAERAKESAASLLEEARAIRASTLSFILSNTDDIDEDPLVATLTQAGSQLEEIASRAVGMVDYIAICREIRSVMQAIEGVRGDAKRQDDEMEQLRQRRDRERAEGQTAISRLRTYVGAHQADVGDTLNQSIQQAVDSLAGGDRQTDGHHVAIDCYQSAEEIAEAALGAAQQIVKNAEAARAAQRALEAERIAAIAAAAERERQQQAAARRQAQARSYSSTTNWGSIGYTSTSSTRSSGGGFKSTSSRSGFGGGGGGGFKSSSSRSGFGGGGGGGFKSSSKRKGW